VSNEPDTESRPTEGSGDGSIEKSEEWNILNEMGGPQGIADSSLPGLLFVAVYSVTGGELKASAIAAVGLAALIALVRLIRGEPLRFAVAGFFGVALAGFIATRTGRAEDFFLPGLFFNAGYALAYAISIFIGWPLIGVIIGPVTGEGMSWRSEPEKVKAFSRASWIWVGMFLLRLAVQLPLYLTGALLALGIAKTAMGLPVFLVCLWLTWLMLRAHGIDLGAFRQARSSG
jgi:hypothetical protein